MFHEFACLPKRFAIFRVSQKHPASDPMDKLNENIARFVIVEFYDIRKIEIEKFLSVNFNWIFFDKLLISHFDVLCLKKIEIR